MQRNPTLLSAAFAFAAALGAPQAVQAAELKVNLVEDAHGVTVQIRGVSPGSAHERVATSKNGAMVVLPGDNQRGERFLPTHPHRLEYVQVARTGDGVGVRLAQAKSSQGEIAQFLHTQVLADGLDMRIDDQPSTLGSVDITDPSTSATVASAPERQDALARLAGLPSGTTDPAPATPAPTATAALPTSPAQPSAAPDPTLDSPTQADPSPRTRWAAAGPAEESTAPANAEQPGRSTVGLVAFFVLVGLAAGSWWWRRRHPSHTNTEEAMRVISRVAIGPRQQILWLNAGGRSLLVGATEQRVDLLADLSRTREPTLLTTPGDPTNVIPLPWMQTPEASAKAPMPATTAPTAQVATATPMETPQNPTAAPPVDTMRMAAFKQRLRAALGEELAGGPESDDNLDLPAHLELLAGEPKWAGRKDAA